MEIHKPYLQNQNESEILFPLADSGQSQQRLESWDSLVVGALEVASNINPYLSDLPVGTVVPSLDAVGWSVGQRNCDIRPRLYDKSSDTFRLVDSGSQITATVRKPEDKLDSSMRLIAVNGSKINTYGVRTIEVKLNRKSYSMPAVVCDIKQDILGMDFLNK